MSGTLLDWLKLLDVPVAHDCAFVFIVNGKHPLRAQTLREFISVVATLSAAELKNHLRQHDFSRWIGGVFGDDILATQLHNIVEARRLRVEGFLHFLARSG